MALFLVGVIYFAIGVSETAVRRELLQDAADETAFATATVTAHGMNFVALTNVLMVGTMAAVQAVDFVLQVTDGCANAPGISSEDKHVCQTLYDMAQLRKSESRSDLQDLILTTGSSINEFMMIAVPELAQNRAIGLVGSGRRPVSVVFAYDRPGFTDILPLEAMPIHDDVCHYARDRWLWRHAEATYPGWPLSPEALGNIRSNVPSSIDAAADNVCHSIRENFVARIQGGIGPGSENLQRRGFAAARQSIGPEEQGVRLASRPNTNVPLHRSFTPLTNAGRVAFAQAEYVFMADAAPIEWMFNPQWRARLRRFQVPPENPSGVDLVGRCNQNGRPNRQDCVQARFLNLAQIRNAIVH